MKVRSTTTACAALGSLGSRTLCRCAIILFGACLNMHSADLVGKEVSTQDLIETKEIATPTLSPDGRYIAFLVETRSVNANAVGLTWYVERLTPKPDNARVVADGGVPIRESFGPLTPAHVLWSPDSQWIYFAARRSNQVQVWRAARAGGTVQEVTHDPADVKSFVLSRDGRRLYYSVGAARRAIEREEGREYERGVLLTPTVEVSEPILYNYRNDDGTRTTERRGEVDAFELLSDGSPRVRVLMLGRPAHNANAAERAEYTRLLESESSESDRLLYGGLFNRTGEYLATSRGSETVFWKRLSPAMNPLYSAISYQRMLYQLVLKRADTREIIRCRAPVCREYVYHFGAVTWRPRSNEVVWASQSELGATTLYAWNVERNTVRTVFTSDAELGGTTGVERMVVTGCAVLGGEAVCVSSNAVSPPRLEEINVDTGAQRVLFDPNSQLRKERFANIRYLRWEDKWGKSHVGVLVIPQTWKRGSPLPLVITGYHCSGFLESASGGTVSPFVLAEAGFAVLCSDMDFRLGTRPEYPGRKFGPGQQLLDLRIMLDSWESGIEYLDKQGVIDETRIGVAGLSFGSEAVWYALTHSAVIAAATTSGPPWMDPFNYFMYGTAVFNQFVYRGMPDPTSPGAMNFYKMASGALNVDKITAPVLVEAPEESYISGMETYTELNRFKKPYEVYIFQDEYHDPQQPRRLMVIQERNEEWFEFWLEGYEVPGSRQRQEYDRWEKLCRMQKMQQGSHTTRCVARAAM